MKNRGKSGLVWIGGRECISGCCSFSFIESRIYVSYDFILEYILEALLVNIDNFQLLIFYHNKCKYFPSKSIPQLSAVQQL